MTSTVAKPAPKSASTPNGKPLASFSELSAFLWSIADLLRGDYKHHDFGKVILPFTVLRRLDCVLADTKPAVLKEHEKRKAGGQKAFDAILNKAAGAALPLRARRPRSLRGGPGIDQDLEPDPEGGGDRICEGVAHDRVISVGDPEMRHGRKSRSKTINGYKRHIIVANRVILGTAVEPANRREHEPVGQLLDAARKHGRIVSAHFDRGHLPCPELAELWRAGTEVRSRAWASPKNGLFRKEHFRMPMKSRLVVCPADQVARITPGGTASFTEDQCSTCSLKTSFTTSTRRTLSIHANEAMLVELREAQQTSEGRAAYRERTAVEHRLARLDAIQGSEARYKGARKNELDVNRSAAVANLQEVARLRRAA